MTGAGVELLTGQWLGKINHLGKLNKLDDVSTATRAANVLDDGIRAANNVAGKADDVGKVANKATDVIASKGVGFGIDGGKKLAPGVLSDEVSQFYSAVATSDRFATKLSLANRISKGPAASVDDVLSELGRSEFLQISKVLGSRIDPTSSGFVFRHGGGTGYFGRITAEHELLHLAQFIRTPSLRSTAGNLSFFKRQGFELVPGLIGSPELHATLGSTVLVGLGYTGVQLWGAAGEIYEVYWGANAQ